MSLDNFIESLSNEVKNGLSMDIAIERLHKNDYTITETMKFLVTEYGLSLDKAKVAVSECSVWNQVVESSRVMQDELIEEANNINKNKLIKGGGDK